MIEALGPYRILKRLGSGGMGEVYLAEDERLHRKVALKVLGARQAEDQENQKRLRREAQAVARLDHPNICTVYEVGDWERGTYIAMQAVEGSNLSELMTRGRFTLSEVLGIGIQTADALIEAHGKGILHRDLKPHNLMLTPKGQVKVLDFGLAKPMTKQALGESVASGVGLTIGTVPYMSPEQVRGEDLDARSDLFSLGLVLYELATGQRAFQSDSAVEVMAAILKEEPPQMRDEGQLLHPGLKAILGRLLEKDRDYRTPSAQVLKSELEQLRMSLSGGGALHDLPTAKVPLPLRLRRAFRKMPRWALVSGVVGLVAGAGLMGWGLRRPSRLDSVAVLPFANATGDAEVEYVADGLTEDLIQQLSQSEDLRVIARSSVLRFKGRDQDLRTIASELGVRTLLTGRLVKRGGEVSLNLELVDADEQRHLWGDQITRPLDDLQGTEFSVASAVGQRLGRRPLERATRVDNQAYQLYLQGRFYADRYTLTDVERALGYFDQALVKDPKFALAHVGKANAYWGLSGTYKPSGEMMALVKTEAQRALDLDSKLGEAFALRGIATYTYDLDAVSAERDFKRSLELAKGSAMVHETYGYFLWHVGRMKESEQECRRGIDLDPLSPLAWNFLSITQNSAGDYKGSLASAKKALALEPDFWWGNLVIAVNEYRLGHIEEALRASEAAAASGSNYAIAHKGRLLALAGRSPEARAILAFLKSDKAKAAGYVSPIHIAMVCAALNERDEAIKYLHQAIELKEEEVSGLFHLDHWKELREEPKLQALLTRLRNNRAR
jgi:serine/threonine-protein kinase